MTVFQRALRYVRGEGWIVTKIGENLYHVRQGNDLRKMKRSEIIQFAGIEL